MKTRKGKMFAITMIPICIVIVVAALVAPSINYNATIRHGKIDVTVLSYSPDGCDRHIVIRDSNTLEYVYACGHQNPFGDLIFESIGKSNNLSGDSFLNEYGFDEVLEEYLWWNGEVVRRKGVERMDRDVLDGDWKGAHGGPS